MLFHFGDTLVEIDTEATRNYYLTKNHLNDCACLGCQNFRQWTKYCPPEIHEQFHQFGIDDLNQIVEIIPCDMDMKGDQQQGMLYVGFYQVIGRIIEYGESAKMKLSENFIISVSEEPSLSLPDFPKPNLYIDIYEAYIPWVLAASMEDYIC